VGIRRAPSRPDIIGVSGVSMKITTPKSKGDQGPAEMPGAGRDPEGPVEIQLSLTLSLSAHH